MATSLHIPEELAKERNSHSKEDQLLHEAQKAMIQGRLSEKNILNNLKFYNSSFEFLDEDEVDTNSIFTPHQIKNTCIKLRLRFLPSQDYKGEIPYEALGKIEQLNAEHRKELKHFKILASKEFFSDPHCASQSLLFAQTLYGNYFHVHTWGNPLKKKRKWLAFPLRNFESFVICLLVFNLVECLLIPDRYLTTDLRATYFSMYRIAAYFHLLILNLGLLVFLLFAFHINFSEQIWDAPVKEKKS